MGALPSDLLIRHASEPGWGIRPARAATVRNDGTVEIIQPWFHEQYLGDPSDDPESYAERRACLEEQMRAGTTRVAVSLRRIRTLVQAILDADFFNLEVPEDNGMICDAGWNEILFRHQGRARRIDYSGAERWEPFHRLCRRIDRLAGLQGW